MTFVRMKITPMLRSYYFFFLCVVLSQASNAQQGAGQSFGNGLLNYTAADKSFSVKFAPRFQTRYYAAAFAKDHYGTIDQTFLIRRARFKFDGWAYSPSIIYKLEYGLSNDDLSGGSEFTKNTDRLILDAIIRWKFAPGFELWAGQTKLPGNIERVVSSANLQFIDRSILNSFFNIDRDQGMQLRHRTSWGNSFVTRGIFAISQGEGRNVATGNQGGLEYTARIELLPFGEFADKGDYVMSAIHREETPKLMLSYTYDLNHRAVKTRGNMGSYMYLSDGALYESTIETHFIDAMFKFGGFSFMGEWALRSSNNPFATNKDGSLTGDVIGIGSAWNACAGQFISPKLEVAARASSVTFDPITALKNKTEVTLGLNKFISGHNLKVQSDLGYLWSNGSPNSVSFRTGFELHF